MFKENLLLKLVIKSVLKAGSETLKIYRSENFETEFKDDNSPLTKADKISNFIITKSLIKTGIPVLSEEGKNVEYSLRVKWKKFWLIDPIDGTKEFLKRNGEFTINVALIEDSKPVMGVVYAPELNLLYFSIKGFGSYKYEMNNFSDLEVIYSNSVKIPLKIKKNNFIIVTSNSHMSDATKSYITELEKKLKHKLKILKMGSSLKLCLVAEGVADLYPRLGPTMEWDTAAAHSICNECGIRVTDLKTNSELRYNKRSLLNNSFIVK